MTAQNATSDITNGGSSERTVRYMFVVPENRAVISFPLTKLCFLFSLLEDEEYYPHFDAEQRAQITGALETMVDHRPLKPWQPTYLDLLAKLEEAVDS